MKKVYICRLLLKNKPKKAKCVTTYYEKHINNCAFVFCINIYIKVAIFMLFSSLFY